MWEFMANGNVTTHRSRYAQISDHELCCEIRVLLLVGSTTCNRILATAEDDSFDAVFAITDIGNKVSYVTGLRGKIVVKKGFKII